MKKKRKFSGRKLLSFLITLTMLVGMMPGLSLTALAYDGNPYASLVNTTTKVTFNGKPWYIIADDSTAVDAGTVTLLAADTSFGTKTFDAVNYSNKYSTSEIRTYLDSLTKTGGSFADVADAIETVKIKGSDSDTEVDAKLYLLSTAEANNLSNDVRKINFTGGDCMDGEWWLRSPGDIVYKSAFVYGDYGFVYVDGNFVYLEFGVRPALKLNLSSVIFSSESKEFTLKPTGYSVTVTAGSNMTKTATSGDASQTGLSGAMTPVVYTANEGYYFPTNYSVTPVNGISVTRNSYTQITVSGTPTANAAITLTAPTAKTKPSAPTTAAAVNCTTAANNDGKLTGVTTAMEYQKKGDTTWTAGTGNDITGLVPGTYYVRMKATDTTLASDNQELTIKTFISATVTFKVANGKWNDETTADKTVTLTGHEGDTLKLTAAQIPAVGNKPNDTYKAGSWNVTPSTETAITENTTYTYTYAQKESISATVTFKVANGKWDDETTADKTVTLTGYEGDTLKLTAAQIPAVGSKPNDTYKAGSWNVTPSTETAITGATTYTYTYAQKETAVVTIAPTAKTLTNTGSAQELVTAGKAEGGTMQYALGTATEATEQYTTSIPTATDAGTYYVWYKVVGDDVHLDTDPACIKVKILNTGMFADIEYGTWKYMAAEAVYDKKIMVGKGMVDGKIIFAPDDKVNRSQLVTSIYAMDGKPAVDYVQQFSDVNENDWFAKAVTWAANNGITVGTGAGQFGVTGNATREQVAVMLYKYAKYCGYDVSISESTTLDGFADADKVHDWALDAVKWAVERKIISGKGSGSNLKIAPEQGATRIECAAMLNKFSEVCTVVVIPDEILEEPLALPMEDIEETPASEDEIEDVIVDEDEEIIDEEDSEVVDEESDVIDEEDSEVADEESEVIDEEESEVTEEDSEAIDEEAEVIDNQETEE